MDTDTSSHVLPAAYLTAGIPPVGGLLRERPEDFIVEEVPAYQPSGQGEHIYLFVQKYNMPASQLISILARHFGVRESDIGYAGLKDRRAVTRQVVSIHAPGRTPESFPSLQHDRVQILWADLHTNKLRRGHLKANRFAIKIRRVPLAAVFPVRRALLHLAQVGVPNRAGEQRFGAMGNNHIIGMHALRADFPAAVAEILRPFPFDPAATSDSAAESGGGVLNDAHQAEARQLYAQGRIAEAARLMPRYAHAEHAVLAALARGASPAAAYAAIAPVQRAFYLSAFQSAVFNAVLDARLAAGTLATLLPGDIAFKHENGAAFAVTDETLADPATADRLAALEISPSGPMWAAAMLRAAGNTAIAEADALARAGIQESHLAAFDQASASHGGKDHLQGARRPLRVPLTYPEVDAGADEHGMYIRCSFELPPGAFATVVMRELMKPDLAPSPSIDAAKDHHDHAPTRGASAPSTPPSPAAAPSAPAAPSTPPAPDARGTPAPRPAEQPHHTHRPRPHPNTPTLIVFDLGGVVVRICRSWKEACAAAGIEYREAFDRQGTDPAAHAARRALVRKYETGDLDSDAFIHAVAQATAGLYSPAEFRAIHDAWILHEYPGVDRLIDDLHRQGLSTGVLSNTNALHWQQLAPHPAAAPKFPTPSKVQHLHASHLLRLAKPDRAIYDRFAQLSGTDPARILFFDDLPDNIAGAHAAGWHAHLIDHTGDTAAQMRTTLTHLGLLNP